MSSIFKSAAMTLLSKTLQTLLYKYLEDVDVEGVALPSISGSDGHSGWGVRLSNVKLRSGAKLMDLAAPTRKKRSKKKRAKKKIAHPKTAEDLETETAFPKEENHHVRMGKEGVPAANTVPSAAAEDVDDTQSLPTLAESEMTAPSAVSSEPLLSSKKADTPKRSSSWLGSSSSEAPTKVVTKSDEKNNSHKAPQRSSSWLSGWYSSSSAPPSQKEVTTTEIVEEESAQSEHSEQASAQDSIPNTCVESDKEQTEGTGTSDLGDVVAGPENESGINEKETGDDIRPVNNDDTDEEDEEADPLPMILRLGQNCRIGTLDVRLVGKDVHVLVEDADFTVEAVPIYRGPGAEEGHSASTADTNTAPKKTIPPPKQKPDPKTVGDRIMAENALARIMSVLPNLLLRDIRLRLIILNQPTSEDGPAGSMGDEDSEHDEKSVLHDDPPVIELCVELLSITDGHDFFAHFRSTEDQNGSVHREDDDDDSSADSQEGERYYHAQSSSLLSRSDLDADDEAPLLSLPKNDYLTKRIRTGRGADGGILLRILPGSFDGGGVAFGEAEQGATWPRQRWKSEIEDFVLLRCSGLDLQARIFMGSKTQVQFQGSSAWYTPGDGDDGMLDEYSVDAMLFAGVDYIVPGPQPPSLPPIVEESTKFIAPTPSSDTDILWELPGATTYQLDANGIQSSWVDTSFHRVARGLVPTICSNVHLPCEYCPACWQGSCGNNRTHVLDAAAPLGGLVLQVSIRDVLEINVDRPSLDVIGLAAQLFNRKNQGESATEGAGEVEGAALPTANTAGESARNVSAKSGHTVTEEVEREPSTNEGHVKPQNQDWGDIKEAFPAYMQPEKIQYLGMHVTEVKFRIHLMREPETMHDSGFCFSYWDACAKCITMDLQKLSGNVKQFQDLRFDVGHLQVSEYSGIEHKHLVSIGLQQRQVDFEDMTLETLMTREDECQRPPWPSTAAVLLDIPPPLETLIYETRERHAIQLRVVSLGVPCSEKHKPDRIQTMAHVKLGPASAEIPRQIVATAQMTIQQAKACIISSPHESSEVPPPTDPQAPIRDNLLRYKVELDGARVHFGPIVNIRLPLSTITGEHSSAAGFSIETMLDHFQLKFGEKEKLHMLAEQSLPLASLAALPDPLRLRIFFFLDDLNPLATALGIKESSPFLLHKVINKQIDKLAKRSNTAKTRVRTASNPPASAGSAINSNNRRQTILTELLKLDDSTLDELWETHLRQQRRSAKHETLPE